jgi:hypothetical protein
MLGNFREVKLNRLAYLGSNGSRFPPSTPAEQATARQK